MTSDDDRGIRPAGDPTDESPTLFEKRGGPPGKPAGGRSRFSVGVIAALFFAVLVILGVVLFVVASSSGTGPTGSTTGGIVLLLPI